MTVKVMRAERDVESYSEMLEMMLADDVTFFLGFVGTNHFWIISYAK